MLSMSHFSPPLGLHKPILKAYKHYEYKGFLGGFTHHFRFACIPDVVEVSSIFIVCESINKYCLLEVACAWALLCYWHVAINGSLPSVLANPIIVWQKISWLTL